MKTIVLDAPAFAFIVATRAVLAGGIGLLLSGRVPEERRRCSAAFAVRGDGRSPTASKSTNG